MTRMGVECPRCHQGELVEKRSKKGRTFYGCERYPACDFTSWNKPVPQPCPKCGSPYMEEVGRRGQLRCPRCGHDGRALAQAGD